MAGRKSAHAEAFAIGAVSGREQGAEIYFHHFLLRRRSRHSCACEEIARFARLFSALSTAEPHASNSIKLPPHKKIYCRGPRIVAIGNSGKTPAA
jgi:hypothetical protein